MPETGPTLTAAWKFGAGKTQSHSLNFHSHERVRKGKKKKKTHLPWRLAKTQMLFWMPELQWGWLPGPEMRVVKQHVSRWGSALQIDINMDPTSPPLRALSHCLAVERWQNIDGNSDLLYVGHGAHCRYVFSCGRKMEEAGRWLSEASSWQAGREEPLPTIGHTALHASHT